MHVGLVQSCHDVCEGGLAVELAEMAIAGRLGARVERLPDEDVTTALFSESTGRFVLEVAPDDVERVRDALGEPIVHLGEVTADPTLALPGCSPLPVAGLAAAWQRTGAAL